MSRNSATAKFRDTILCMYLLVLLLNHENYSFETSFLVFMLLLIFPYRESQYYTVVENCDLFGIQKQNPSGFCFCIPVHSD